MSVDDIKWKAVPVVCGGTLGITLAAYANGNLREWALMLAVFYMTLFLVWIEFRK